MNIKISNSWKNVSEAMVKVSGTWKYINAGYVKVNGTWKKIYSSLPDGAVDLGLPSGTLWAKGNIIQDGSSYKIGNESDYGAYVSWGNVTPHFSSNGSSFNDSYNWGSSNSGTYASTSGSSVSFTSQHKNADYTANSGNDAAHELLGDNWRMPTASEFEELNSNCTSEWTTINGVAGYKFTSNINGKYIFFPAGGFGNGTTLNFRGAGGFYWSSSLYSADKGYYLDFTDSSLDAPYRDSRYRGFSIRAVYDN